jgi:hypothetical protein
MRYIQEQRTIQSDKPTPDRNYYTMNAIDIQQYKVAKTYSIQATQPYNTTKIDSGIWIHVVEDGIVYESVRR